MGVDNRESRSSLVVSALLVVIFALTTALLLLSAFIIWFAEVIGSLTLSLSITSIITGGAALCIYKISLSPTLKRLREEYEMITSIVRALRGGCYTVLSRVLKFIGI